MKNCNIHITMTECTNESRLLKQVHSLKKSNIFNSIYIIALGSEKLNKHEIISPGIELIRLVLISRRLPRFWLFQVVKYIEFFIRSVWKIRKLRINVVNAHSLAALPIACICESLFGVRVIYDAHELETEQICGKSLRKSFSKWVEKKTIHCCDLMIVVSESIADWYVDEYDIKRPSVILNVPKKRALRERNHFRKQFAIRNDQVILLYQGGLAAGRCVNLILDAFKARQDDKVVVVFMGYGPLQQTIQIVSAEHKNIFFHHAVSPDLVLEYTASADLGFSLIQNTCLNNYYCMPNKLFEYAMAGLPVLVSNMKDMSALVTKHQMGAVISGLSAAGINRAIDDFLMQDLATMKVNAYRVACEHAWEMQEQKMLAAYQAIGLSAAT